MENQQNNISTHISLNQFVKDNKVIVYTIIILFFIVLSFGAYLIYNELFSEKSKAQAAINLQTTQSIQKHTEALASVPEIVKGFSLIIENELNASFIIKEKEIDIKIQEKFLSLENDIKKMEDKLKFAQLNLQKLLEKNQKISNDINISLTFFNKKEDSLKTLFPNIEKYKDTHNPELLLRELKKLNWKEGTAILVQMEAMIEASKDDYIKVPSKYIEGFGDWCRDNNQFDLAKKFYMEAVKRNPESISAQVELHSLLLEYDASLRDSSTNKLMNLALNNKLQNIDQLKRFLNALIEVDNYQTMYRLINKLIESSKYDNRRIYLATLYKNRARAIKEIKGYLTKEAMEDIQESFNLAPDDQNVLYGYIGMLIDRKNYEESLPHVYKLLSLDSNDINYYLLLASIYNKMFKKKQAVNTLIFAKENLYLSEVDNIKLMNSLQKYHQNNFYLLFDNNITK